jgi:hypothetical protein
MHKGLHVLIGLCLGLYGCAESVRENIVDPVNAPTVEMSAPVLDGGSILIEWRYLAEGSDLNEFRITKTVSNETVEVGRQAAQPEAAWQSASIRDSVLVADIEVTYRVTSLLTGGAESTSASGKIRIEGPKLAVSVDPVSLMAVLSWSEPIPGTAGYEIVRKGDSTAETVYSTDDGAAGNYADPIPEDGKEYVYELTTVLENGIRLTSRGVKAGVMVHVGVQSFGVGRLLLIGWSLGGATVVLANGGSASTIHVLGSDHLPLQGLESVAFALETLSLSPAHPDTGGIYLAGLEAGRVQLQHHDVVSSEVPVPDQVWGLKRSTSFPTAGATSTGMSIVDQGGQAFLLVYSGATLRTVDGTLSVVEEITLSTGEPSDIAQKEGTVWLAYSDRLITGLFDGSLAEMTWEDVPIPTGVTLTGIEPFRDGMILFDGVNAKFYLIELDGNVLASWDALGPNLGLGDIADGPATITEGRDERLVFQSDGSGQMHVFMLNWTEGD